MPKIIITKECDAQVRRLATLPFKDTSRALPNGDREVEISDDVYERLDMLKFGSETFSDAVLRLIASMGGRKPN